MSYQVLARKWRPRRFEDLIGQSHVVRALNNALTSGRLHHAYLFSGTRGVGKTTLARILAKALNCEAGVSASPCGECSACTEIDEGRFFDLIEVDAASRTRVEETRELLENVQYAPTRGRFKVYIIDEVHMFSNHSFNALLKTLEEPPEYVKFLLATTDPKKLPVTILSRCLHFSLKRITPTQIEQQIETILEHEQVASDRESRRLVANAADGSLRDGLSLLDQAIAYGNGALKADDVSAMLGTVAGDQVLVLMERLADKDAQGVLELVDELDQRAPDYLAVLAELLSQLRRVAIKQMVPKFDDASAGDTERIDQLAGRLTAEETQLFYQIALVGRRDLPLSVDLRSGFEMVLLRMLAFNRMDGSPPAKAVTPQADTLKTEQSAALPATRSTQSKAATAQTPEANEGQNTPPPRTHSSPAQGSDWRVLIDQLKLTGLVRELACNCEFENHQNNVFRLSLSDQHLPNQGMERRLETALKGHFGDTLRLEITYGVCDDRSTPNGIKARESDRRQQVAEQAIAADPNVQQLQQTFGATLDAGSIRPQEDTGT